LCLTATFWMAACDTERSTAEAVKKLPPEVRAEVFERSLANLRALCEPLRDGFHEYCRDLGRWLLQFPECDATCRSLAMAPTEHFTRPR
jgi:hypothetical protein